MVILGDRVSHNSGYISTNSGKLHYLKYGNGEKLLIAFHGYGESASLFSIFEQYVKDDYTIISFNLPYHEDSIWPDSARFTTPDLALLIKNTLQLFSVDKASLIGYSMGGRVCLKALEIVSESILQIILVASDGLVFNPFYYFLTRTILGKALFHNFLTNPKPYKSIIGLGRRFKLITEHKYKFASKYISNSNDRAFLLKVWPVMSLLIPNINKINKVVSEHNIFIDVFMGKYDNIIPLRHADKFNKAIRQSRIHVLEKGHRIFDNNTVPQIASVLL